LGTFFYTQPIVLTVFTVKIFLVSQSTMFRGSSIGSLGRVRKTAAGGAVNDPVVDG
jgi:hypothetical protein